MNKSLFLVWSLILIFNLHATLYVPQSKDIIKEPDLLAPSFSDADWLMAYNYAQYYFFYLGDFLERANSYLQNNSANTELKMKMAYYLMKYYYQEYDLKKAYKQLQQINISDIKRYHPNPLEYYKFVAELSYKLGFYKDAELIYATILKTYPNDVQTAINFYNLLLNENKITSAIQLVNIYKLYKREDFSDKLAQLKLYDKRSFYKYKIYNYLFDTKLESYFENKKFISQYWQKTDRNYSAKLSSEIKKAHLNFNVNKKTWTLRSRNQHIKSVFDFNQLDLSGEFYYIFDQSSIFLTKKIIPIYNIAWNGGKSDIYSQSIELLYFKSMFNSKMLHFKYSLTDLNDYTNKKKKSFAFDSELKFSEWQYNINTSLSIVKNDDVVDDWLPKNNHGLDLSLEVLNIAIEGFELGLFSEFHSYRYSSYHFYSPNRLFRFGSIIKNKSNFKAFNLDLMGLAGIDNDNEMYFLTSVAFTVDAKWVDFVVDVDYHKFESYKNGSVLFMIKMK